MNIMGQHTSSGKRAAKGVLGIQHTGGSGQDQYRDKYNRLTLSMPFMDDLCEGS
jgi:hypothetical protein